MWRSRSAYGPPRGLAAELAWLRAELRRDAARRAHWLGRLRGLEHGRAHDDEPLPDAADALGAGLHLVERPPPPRTSVAPFLERRARERGLQLQELAQPFPQGRLRAGERERRAQLALLVAEAERAGYARSRHWRRGRPRQAALQRAARCGAALLR